VERARGRGLDLPQRRQAGAGGMTGDAGSLSVTAVGAPKAEARCHRVVAAELIGDRVEEPGGARLFELSPGRVPVKGQSLSEVRDSRGGRLRIPPRTQDQAEPRRSRAIAPETACSSDESRWSAATHLALRRIPRNATEFGDQAHDGRVNPLACPLVSWTGQTESRRERLVPAEAARDHVEHAAHAGIPELLRRWITREATNRHKSADLPFGGLDRPFGRGHPESERRRDRPMASETTLDRGVKTAQPVSANCRRVGYEPSSRSRLTSARTAARAVPGVQIAWPSCRPSTHGTAFSSSHPAFACARRHASSRIAASP
jgi:hypothetical protein